MRLGPRVCLERGPPGIRPRPTSRAQACGPASNTSPAAQRPHQKGQPTSNAEHRTPIRAREPRLSGPLMSPRRTHFLFAHPAPECRSRSAIVTCRSAGAGSGSGPNDPGTGDSRADGFKVGEGSGPQPTASSPSPPIHAQQLSGCGEPADGDGGLVPQRVFRQRHLPVRRLGRNNQFLPAVGTPR